MLIHLLNGFVRHARRSGLVAKGHEQVPDFGVVRLQFDIFLVGGAGLGTAAEIIGQFGKVIPFAGLIRRQFSGAPLAEKSGPDLAVVLEAGSQFSKFVGGKFALALGGAATKGQDTGLGGILNPAIDLAATALGQKRPDEFSNFIDRAPSVAKLGNQGSKRI